MKIKQKNGISLIVLVITIIVMIVLAAAIILSIQSSGIIGRANEAKVGNDIASQKEFIELKKAEWQLMSEVEKEEKGNSFVSYVEGEMEAAGVNVDNFKIEESGEIIPYVAIVDNVKYISLQEAIDTSLESGEKKEIKLVNDVMLTEGVTVFDEMYIVLDLNGYSIIATGNAITNSATLVIKDTSVSKKDNYKQEYDLNEDGVVGQLDIDIIIEHYNESIIEESSEISKKCDVNNDKIINLDDILILCGNNYTDGYALLNQAQGYLTIKDISKEKFSGEPAAIYNKEGTVNGYEF